MSSASWNGSDLIYNRVIRPFVLKHQKKIDDAIDQAADKLKDGMPDISLYSEAELQIRGSTEDN